MCRQYFYKNKNLSDKQNGGCAVSALLMGVCVFFVRNGIHAVLPAAGLMGKLIRLFVPALVGVVVYFALTWFLRVPTITEKLKRGAE